MRNLKKVLSLALALVMLVGMMVVGAGAVETDFADNGKIGDDYKEAVAVMSAIKVLGGKENNNFDPQGTLTRAEAAKILCVMTMGADAAEGLAGVTKSGVFTDMPDHWAAGYVDACYNKGIVLGMAEGIYGPSNTLTGTQFAAMLLRAMGVEGEFTGPSWESAVIAAAAKAKLSEMTTKPIAREAASKMAFDGLQYSPSGSKSYTVGNQSFDDFFEAYIYAQNNGGKIEITTAKDSLASTVFGLKKADQSANGRNGYTWQLDNKDITGFMPTDGVLYVSTDGTTLANIAVKADDNVKYFLNGTEKTTSTDVTNEIKRGNELTLVDVDGDDKYDKVLVVKKELKTATADPVEKNEKVSITGVLTKATDVKLVSGWEDVEKGDKVLTYKLADGITYIEKLNVVTGEVTKRTGSGTNARAYTVDGSEYYVATVDDDAKTAAVDALNGALGKDSSVDLYLDGDDNVWAVESSVTVPVNYAVLVDIVWVKGQVTAGGGNNGYAEAKLLLMDGSTIIRRVDSLNYATPTWADTDNSEMSSICGASSGQSISTAQTSLNAAYTYDGTGKTGSSLSSSDKLTEGKYYKVAATAEISSQGKGTIYVGIKDANDATDFEGVFYTYADADTANHITMVEVGIANKKGESVANTELTNATVTKANYTSGTPSIGSPSVGVNNNTKFVVYNTDTKKYEPYTGITGETAMPGFTAGSADFQVLKTKSGNTAAYAYLQGVTTAPTNVEYIFITSTDWDYTASSKIYTYNAIVDGEETTVEVSKDLTGTITTAGLYSVERDSKDQIVSATAATQTGVVGASDATSLTKAEAGTIKVGGDDLVYNDDSVVFYIDKDGVVSTGKVADVEAATTADDSTLVKAWAVVTTKDAVPTSTIETLYVLTKAADETPETPSTDKIALDGVTKNTSTSAALNNSDALKKLPVGAYTFENMPNAITDSGIVDGDKTELLLFRWAGDGVATIIIRDSKGNAVFNGETGLNGSGSAHYAYIVVGKTVESVAKYAADQCAVLPAGSYTWTVTINSTNTQVASGEFTTK